MSNDLFDRMFKNAETVSLEDFTDTDVESEGIDPPELSEETVFAEEGFVTAVLGDVARVYSDAYREMKGWFIGIESKRKFIDENCKETIEWLREEDRSNPKLDLDVGKFKTWMKTSETFYWRYYFILHDGIYGEILSALKQKDITGLEVSMDFNMRDRMKVTNMLDSVRSIKDLIVIVEKYRSRVNFVTEALVKRNRRIQGFPFQVMLLGYNDLNRTVKKIVNLAD